MYSAEASVQSAEKALANTKLYAPISGTIVSLVEPSARRFGQRRVHVVEQREQQLFVELRLGRGGTGTTAGSLGGSGSSSSIELRRAASSGRARSPRS